jgi:hypothetical protein
MAAAAAAAEMNSDGIHQLLLSLLGIAHHHHQITKLSHSINAIGPAPHRSGRKRA